MADVDLDAVVDLDLLGGGLVDVIQPAPYHEQITDLLPPGAAWTRDRTSTLSLLLMAVALEFSRVGVGARVMLEREYDPRTTTWLIDEWEEYLGLPICGPQTSLAARRSVAHAKLVGRGFNPFEFYDMLAASLGYVIVILEYWTLIMRCDSRCDSRLYGEEWKHVYKVITTKGDNDELLKCTLKYFSPSHTLVIFDFEDP